MTDVLRIFDSDDSEQKEQFSKVNTREKGVSVAASP